MAPITFLFGVFLLFWGLRRHEGTLMLLAFLLVFSITMGIATFAYTEVEKTGTVISQ